MRRHNRNSDINPAKIIGVQFSLLSPQEIRKTSVAEITTRDTYINDILEHNPELVQATDEWRKTYGN